MGAESTNILYIVVAVLVCAGFVFYRTCRGNDDTPTPERVRDEFRELREIERESQQQANSIEQSAKELQREIGDSRKEIGDIRGEITTVADGIDDVKSDIIQGAIIARESRAVIKRLRERLSETTKEN